MSESMTVGELVHMLQGVSPDAVVLVPKEGDPHSNLRVVEKGDVVATYPGRDDPGGESVQAGVNELSVWIGARRGKGVRQGLVGEQVAPERGLIDEEGEEARS